MAGILLLASTAIFVETTSDTMTGSPSPMNEILCPLPMPEEVGVEVEIEAVVHVR